MGVYFPLKPFPRKRCFLIQVLLLSLNNQGTGICQAASTEHLLFTSCFISTAF